MSLQAAKLREEAGDSQASGHEASPISGIDVDRDDLRVKGWGIIVTRNQSVARELKPCLYFSDHFFSSNLAKLLCACAWFTRQALAMRQDPRGIG